MVKKELVKDSVESISSIIDLSIAEKQLVESVISLAITKAVFEIKTQNNENTL